MTRGKHTGCVDSHMARFISLCQMASALVRYLYCISVRVILGIFFEHPALKNTAKSFVLHDADARGVAAYILHAVKT